MSSIDARFKGIEKLYGTQEYNLLKNSSVLIVGIGGIGTWAAEAIARTGIGEITLVDMDEVCVSNINRQLVALENNIGHSKTSIMCERIKLINPECKINNINNFFTAETATKILNKKYDCVIDCIDNPKNKSLLIAACKRTKTPIVVCGGSGGKRDLSKIKITDLNKAKGDHLINSVKELLIKDYNFPIQIKPFRIKCVYSDEQRFFPQKDGSVCTVKNDDINGKLDCATGFGAASFITGSFAFHAVNEAIQIILKNDKPT